MSNPLSIAAVTNTLRNLLNERLKTSGLGNIVVTTKPPDKARDSNNSANGNQVNLFLYQTRENAAWRNMEIPAPVAGGYPPLALDLYYLLTTYAQNDDYPDPISHKLLGEAMSVFHDHPVLFAEDIKQALTSTELAQYDLYNQIEKVRITPQSITLDDLFKLWAAFQTQYRITAAYTVSVVLIESTRPPKSPLPVLTRGSEDRGVDAQASLTPTYPTLTAINFTELEAVKQVLPPSQADLIKKPAATLGDKLTLVGYNLDKGDIQVLLTNPLLDQPQPIVIFEARTSTTIQFTLPDQLNPWLPGLYVLTVKVTTDAGTPTEQIAITNGLPLLIAPILGSISAARTGDTVVLRVQCKPPVLETQRVALILTILSEELAAGDPTRDVSLKAVNDLEISAKPRSGKATTLEFELNGDILARLDIKAGQNKRIQAGTYQVRPRLRVDGVDSLIVDYVARPPVFTAAQGLVIST
jgi:hypothetical protein